MKGRAATLTSYRAERFQRDLEIAQHARQAGAIATAAKFNQSVRTIQRIAKRVARNVSDAALFQELRRAAQLKSELVDLAAQMQMIEQQFTPAELESLDAAKHSTLHEFALLRHDAKRKRQKLARK